MRRRSTNNGGAHGVLTRSRKQLMELQGYLTKERVVDDAELDEYINRLDETIDATQDVMTWGDDDDDSDASDDGGSDSEEDADYNPQQRKGRQQPTSSRPGFVSHAFWSSIGPCLLLPVLYHRWSYSTYPLSSSSVSSYLVKIVLNWATIVLLACLTFAGVCNTPPFLQGFLFKVPSDVPSCAFHLWHRLHDCVSEHGLECYALPSCQLPLGQLVGALVGVVLVLRFYQRRVQVAVAVLFALHHGLQQWAQHSSVILDSAASFHPRSLIRATSIDPTYAYANESIHILLDGHNLHEGMVVGWVPYWGCSREAAVISDCPVTLVAMMKYGGVTQTFPAIDEYTVCLDTHSASSVSPAPSFTCFPDVRLKVKHIQSTPGWSLQHQ